MEKSSNETGRVTIKQVAQAAKVHYSTVSKALRGRGRIPAATRERILKIAGVLGYQPDSVMQALAAQRSQCSGLHREPRIVFLTNRRSTDEFGSGAFVRQFAEGVRHQAELMGCACDVLSCGDNRDDPAGIETMIDPARTDGLVIGAFDPLLPKLELEWSRYAVVKIDSAFMLPDATLVANDQLQVARMAVHQAARLGYRRIGLAVGQAEEEATRSRYSAGYYVARDELESPEIPILFFREHCDDRLAIERRLADWVREHRPQIVLSSWGSIWELLARGGRQVTGDVACMCLCLNAPDSALAGVIQHHFVVGQKAAEALALLIMRRKQGLVIPSAATYVAGTWQDGASAPPCTSREP